MPMSLERRLAERCREALRELKGFRKPRVEDIFQAGRIYIGPRDLYIENYIRRKPLSAFNPGALLRGGELHIFPRCIFEYYNYSSSIAHFTLDVGEVLEGGGEGPLRVELILWPRELWDSRGCEDARLYEGGGRLLLLYTGVGYMEVGGKKTFVQALAEFKGDWREVRRGYFTIIEAGEVYTPRSKDSAILTLKGSEASMLTRPTIRGMSFCWRCRADMDEMMMHTLEPVLAPEEWEAKTGWSTNALRLSGEEYLVGWHATSKRDLTYRNGLAVVDGEGSLLAVSDYLLEPRGLMEEYGDRPQTLFGCGLVSYKEYLIWIGGLGDCLIGIFMTELEEALERLRWLEG
ncbi:MAG: glycosidase [Candidatus Bathyarchaeota archaeon B23]|nr:MAG: glycosidase [Candidatus Bathyarchaeota archaeon B23]